MDAAVHSATNPQMSPSGTFPFLRNGDTLVGGGAATLAHWRKAGHNIDADLSSLQGAETVAYTGLLGGSLDIARLHTLWAIDDNYREFTRSWYAQVAPFPVGAILTYNARREAVARIQAAGFDAENPQPIYDKVAETLKTLDVRLGDGPFFYGRSPSTMDAVVFSLLAPILRSDLPDDRLKKLVRSHASLVRHFDVISRVYFGGGFGPASSPEGGARAPSLTPEQKSFRRQKWLAVGVSVAAMIGYAIMSGLVSVEVGDGEDEESDDSEEGGYGKDGDYQDGDGDGDGEDDDDDGQYYYDE
eukprot:Opistho-2@74430